jgi:heterodisulfide reductase subunit A
VTGKKDGSVSIRIRDPIIDDMLVIEPDLLVVSPGIVHENVEELARILDLDLDSQGFFVEENVKFRPFDVVRKGGVFVCGSAVRPCYFEEAVASGKIVAARTLALLSRPECAVSRAVAIVKEKWCSGCELCIPACPYSARVFDDVSRIAAVDETQCRGCVACVTICPGGASELRILTGEQVFRMLEKAFS